MNTEEPMDRLAHILYELVDVLDIQSVGLEENPRGPEADERARLTELKTELQDLLQMPQRGQCAPGASPRTVRCTVLRTAGPAWSGDGSPAHSFTERSEGSSSSSNVR
jgi:hypothetical protein